MDKTGKQVANQNKATIQCFIIKYNDENYHRSLNLRNKVLRIPLGMSIYDEDLSEEINQIHIAAFIDDQIVGILVLKEVSLAYKMRQVAIDNNFRRLGIGSQLVRFAEDWIFRHNSSQIELHARREAVLFYEKLGYIALGDEFLEVGIPHVKMYKILNAL